VASIKPDIWYRIEISARCRDKTTLLLKLPYPDNNGYEKKELVKLIINQNNFLLEISLLCLICFPSQCGERLIIWLVAKLYYKRSSCLIQLNTYSGGIQRQRFHSENTSNDFR